MGREHAAGALTVLIFCNEPTHIQLSKRGLYWRGSRYAAIATPVVEKLARPLSRAGFYVPAGFGGHHRRRRAWAHSGGKQGAIAIGIIWKGPGGCPMCPCVLCACGPVPMAQTPPAGHMQPERQVQARRYAAPKHHSTPG